MGDKIDGRADDRRAAVAVAKGQRGGQGDMGVAGDLVVESAIQQRHRRRPQKHGGQHRRHLAARRRDHQVEFIGRPRGAVSQRPFLGQHRDAKADRNPN